jgi:hypothetical protein
MTNSLKSQSEKLGTNRDQEKRGKDATERKSPCDDQTVGSVAHVCTDTRGDKLITSQPRRLDLWMVTYVC